MLHKSLVLLGAAILAAAQPTVIDQHEVTYKGTTRNNVELFLGIRYGKDTGGVNRFKPPEAHTPKSGSTVDATAYGEACPQTDIGSPAESPLVLSEDCLNLNIARPHNTKKGAKLPVMVYIYGGSFYVGSTQALLTSPDGLVLQSVQNGHPVIHVGMNYRLGVFGFAQSDALKAEGSENAGLRDQRLALEWVQNNIANFGGDPDKVTIFGQSSGGLSVGIQLLAYGGSKPAPFHQAICQSQALEPGITGNYTISAVKAITEKLKCASELHSVATVACLRKQSMDTLLKAQVATDDDGLAHNIGDVWLPSVDGDFLPSAPSELIRQKRFANVTTMMGWCEDDLARFIDDKVETAEDTKNQVASYIRNVSPSNLHTLLSLYPETDFFANTAANLSSEFYRTARIVRDIIMVCQPLWYAENMAAAGNDVYLYNWNQTMMGPLLDAEGEPGRGVVHTSEFPYVFGNLSFYDTNGLPFHPSKEDYDIRDRGARSWSTFASTGRPSLRSHKTLQGFVPAFNGTDINVFVVGGSRPGLSAVDGRHATPELKRQRLRERCAFLSTPEMIEQINY